MPPYDRRNRALKLASIGAALLPLTAASATPAVPAWPDTPVARLEVLALLQSLNAALLSHDSATLTLDDWCARHKLAAAGETIVAERVRGVEKPVSAELRMLLQVGVDEPVRYRRVRLRCGALILSEADNWYVPGRLTTAMNVTLDSSDISFGRVVQPLHFRRRTLSAALLWSPLPGDWETNPSAIPVESSAALGIPEHVMEHRAVLVRPDGTPFSALTETYTSAVLAFPPPAISGVRR